MQFCYFVDMLSNEGTCTHLMPVIRNPTYTKLFSFISYLMNRIQQIINTTRVREPEIRVGQGREAGSASL